MPDLTKNAQILKFLLARQQPHGVNRTRLMKFAYLCDLEARKLMGRPISSFTYVWYTHGPFDKALYAAIEELTSSGLAHPSTTDYGSGIEEKLLADRGAAELPALSRAELEVLSFVANRFMSLPLDTLLAEVVYKTKPMLEVERKGQALPMESVDGLDQAAIGFDFEGIVDADHRSRQGDFILSDEFFNALRAEAVAAGTE